MDQRAEPDAGRRHPLRPRDRLDPTGSPERPSRQTPRRQSRSGRSWPTWQTLRAGGTGADGHDAVRRPAALLHRRFARDAPARERLAARRRRRRAAASLAISSSRRRPKLGCPIEIERTPDPTRSRRTRSSPSKAWMPGPHAGERDRVLAIERRVGPEALGPRPRGSRRAADRSPDRSRRSADSTQPWSTARRRRRRRRADRGRASRRRRRRGRLRPRRAPPRRLRAAAARRAPSRPG